MFLSRTNDRYSPTNTAHVSKTSPTNIIARRKDFSKPPKRFYPPPLQNRTGIMKCRALDLLGQASPSHSTHDDVNEEGSRQSGHDGLAFRRNKIIDERDRISKTRAAELSAHYELSDNRNTDLNRNAVISMNPNSKMSSKEVVGRASPKNNDALSEVDQMMEQLDNDKPPAVNARQRKSSFDLARQIRNNFGYPRKSASTSTLDLEHSITQVESPDDRENRIPSHIHCDATNAQISPTHKMAAEKPRSRREMHLSNLKPIHPNIIHELPDIC